MKTTRITVEKIWKDDRPHYKILGFENVATWDELPLEYCAVNPFQSDVPVYYTYYTPYNNYIAIFDPDNQCLEELHVNRTYNVDHFTRMVRLMRAAGERLSAINKKLAWHGTETIEI
jgi:hypothetical protein